MNTARLKRHTKKLLKHPLQLSAIPLIIAGVASTYMFAVALFGFGFRSGGNFVAKKLPTPVNTPYNNPQPINPVIYPKPEVYNIEPDSDELLQMEESDEELKNDLENLINSIDTNLVASSENTEVLGTFDTYDSKYINEENIPNNDSEMYRRSVPVEKRIYTNIVSTPPVVETDVNFVATGTVASLFGIKTVILPVISMALAVFGVNILEHKQAKRKLAHNRAKKS